MKKEALEFASAGVLIIAAVFLINPFDLWMPTMMQIIMLAAIVVAFGGFAVFILRERPTDEREEAHRSIAGRAAFLSGSAVLIAGIVVESLAHRLDPWLVIALATMVLSKVGARMWSEWYR